MIRSIDYHEELEEEGNCSLILVGVRYTGTSSTQSASSLHTNAAWPSTTPFQGGPIVEWVDEQGEKHHIDDDDVDEPRNVDRILEREPGSLQLGLVPDWNDDEVIEDSSRTIDYIESSPNFEVVYDPETIARSLLERGFLPKDIFGREFEERKRDAFFDLIGKEDPGGIVTKPEDEEKWRKMLREVIDTDDEDTEEPEVENVTLKSSLKNDYGRFDLMSGVKQFDDYEETFDNLNKATKSDMVEFLAEKPKDEVVSAMKDATEE